MLSYKLAQGRRVEVALGSVFVQVPRCTVSLATCFSRMLRPHKVISVPRVPNVLPLGSL